MPKLTETTNDQLHKRGPGRPPKVKIEGNGSGLHLTPPHEPLPGEPFESPPAPTLAYSPQVSFTQVQTAPVATVAPAPALKVALIGTAPSSRMLAPYNDPSWQIWACSPGNMGILPKYDAWFEIHGSLLWAENKHYGEPYIKFLSELKVPVYMQDQRYCKNALTYPMREMVAEFGPYFFTSSFSWMIALAIHKGATEIGLYGIDMASRDEYILQRPGIYHFFNKAKERGIKVFAPYESDIMQPPGLYGYSEVTPYGRKMIARAAELKARRDDMVKQRDVLIQNITYIDGAIEDNDYNQSIHGGIQNNTHPDLMPTEGKP